MFTSENGEFSHSRKTIYEEALHKCEEERYEFDHHIEANLFAISVLEPVLRKIAVMGSEEKIDFKLPETVQGPSRVIWEKAIRKIYDRESGNEIMDAILTVPTVALPVVLKRIKQKDEEWKRSQRDWNKIWREIENKNFAKALDYQGSVFKSTDKRVISSKSLVSEIETMYREQREKILISEQNLGPFYQFDFSFKDGELFHTCRDMITRSLESLPFSEKSVTDGNESLNDKQKVNQFLRKFCGRFFWIPTEEFGSDEIDEFCEINEDETESSENENNKSQNRDTDVIMEQVGESEKPSETQDRPKRPSYTMYANTSLYVFFRLYQVTLNFIIDVVFSAFKNEGTFHRIGCTKPIYTKYNFY